MIEDIFNHPTDISICRLVSIYKSQHLMVVGIATTSVPIKFDTGFPDQITTPHPFKLKHKNHSFLNYACRMICKLNLLITIPLYIYYLTKKFIICQQLFFIKTGRFFYQFYLPKNLPISNNTIFNKITIMVKNIYKPIYILLLFCCTKKWGTIVSPP